MSNSSPQYNITLITSEQCNLGCKYCYVSDKNAGVMSKEVVDATFNWMKNELHKEHSDYLFLVDIFGGEPLVNWDVCKMIYENCDSFVETGIDTVSTMFTNMVLLDEEKIKYIRSRKHYTNWNLSLDGCKEAHNHSRVFKDGKGSFDTVMEKMKLLIQFMDVNRLPIKSVIGPTNAQYLLKSVEFFYNMGKKRMSFSVARDNIWDKDSFEIYKKSMREIADFYINHIDDNDLYIDVLVKPLSSKIKHSNKRTNNYCSAGKTYFSVAPNGDIYPCQRLFNNRSPYIIGNVLNGGIDKSNKWYNLFQNYTLDNYINCKNCNVFTHYNCFGQCIASQYEAGNIFTPIPCVCEILKFNYDLSLEIYEKLKNHPNFISMLEKNFGRKNLD